MSYLFILNPIAGNGTTLKARQVIEEEMESRNLKYEILETKFPKNAKDLVLENINDYEVFVAVGGDGTIKEVVSGLAEARKGKMGIIPAGTANDLAKALNLSSDPKESLEAILKGETKYIDVAKGNGSYFLNIGSIGYDAEVIVNYNNMKKKRGVINYYISVIYTLIKYRSMDLEIEIDGKDYSGNTFLVAAGSGQYYGGGFQILPDSILDDGNLHICLIQNISKLKILLLFPSIFFGKHTAFTKYVTVLKGKNIKIKSNKPVALNLDGEILGAFEDINYSIVDYKIPILY